MRISAICWKELVTLLFASWNQIGEWLRHLAVVRQAT